MSSWNPSTADIAGRLRELTPLATLAPSRLHAVAASCSSRELRAGEVLRPLPAESVLFPVAGSVSVRRLANSGQVAVLGVVRPGEFFGLASVVSGAWTRKLVYEATVPSRVIVVPGRTVSDLIDEDRDVAHAILANLATRLLSVEDRLLDTLLLSKSDLVVRMLTRMADVEGGPRARTVWITHQELAWLAGCTRETTTVVLSRLRNEGIVATRPGRIEILDDERLANWRSTT